MLDRQLIEEFPLGEKFSFEQDLLQKKYKDESFYAYPSSAYFIDIGIPEDYKKLIKDRKNRD